MESLKRKHLSGDATFYTYIPSTIENLVSVYDASSNDILSILDSVYSELRTSLLMSDSSIQKTIVEQEAKDSILIAEGKTGNPFSYFSLLNNEDVENIKKAYYYAIGDLHHLPLSSRLIRNSHYIACESSAYDKKYRGEFRNSVVWVGEMGSGLNEAVFIPPVGEDMQSALSDLDNYINYSTDNLFIMAAAIHYQFEMIHPFIDANGRIGRMLNNIFLYEKGVLPYPSLLISATMANTVNEYFTTLQYTHDTRDISKWINYYLRILYEAASNTISLIKSKL